MILPYYSKTKMVATIGPACSEYDVLSEMIRVGVDVCRLNMSHGDHVFHQNLINLIREIREKEKVNVAILMDLQGPKIRMGLLEKPYLIKPGDEVFFNTSIKELQGNKLPMVCEGFARDVKSNDLILVDDGKVELRVIDSNGVDEVRLLVIGGEEIGSKKGVNLPYVSLNIPSLSEKDRKDLMFGIENKVEWIALSFVRSAKDIEELKLILTEHGSKARIIAKIEKPEALEDIDAIIEKADGIMVARGDLGVEIFLEEVPMWQKKIVQKCNIAAKPVIVATQMMESMILNRRPTRAEVTDVANAVIDGADALMLSGETAGGKYPVEVVRTMQKVITQVEANDSIYYKNMVTTENTKTFLSDACCIAAVKLCKGISAKAIVGMTRSGYTANQISKCRPKANIFIFTDEEFLINTLSLIWGVRAFHYDRFEGTNETINDVNQILKEKQFINIGDIVINTGTMPLHSRKRTNMVKVTVVE